eukprot:gene12105-biopygen6424
MASRIPEHGGAQAQLPVAAHHSFGYWQLACEVRLVVCSCGTARGARQMERGLTWITRGDVPAQTSELHPCGAPGHYALRGVSSGKLKQCMYSPSQTKP